MIVVAAVVSRRRGGGLLDSLSFGISIDFLWYETTAPPPFFFFVDKEQPLDLPSPNSQPSLFMDAKEQPGLNYLFFYIIYFTK